MAKRKLKTFHLNKEILSKLSSNGFHVVEDVLSKPFPHLKRILQLNDEEADSLISYLSSACLPNCQTALDLLEKEEKNIICFGDRSLDKILQGGLKKGALTEIAGPPGAGKTQMCFHLTLQCLRSQRSPSAVCYIDTEGSFRSERLIGMMDVSHSEEDLMNKFLLNLHVLKPTDIASLSEIFQTLEVFCLEKDVGLVVIDSIASLVRKEFSHNSIFERSALLASWAAELKALADQLNVAVVVTNQVTTRSNSSTSGNRENDTQPHKVTDSGLYSVCPALGNTWPHFVNTRLILHFHESNTRELIVAKSPVCPFATKEFSITSSGISFNEKTYFDYDCIDPNSHVIGVDPGLPIK